MQRSVTFTIAAAVVLCMNGFAATGALADAQTESVLKAELAGAQLEEANIIRFEVEPGWETKRHIHPGHVFVYVTEGSIKVNVEGQPQRTVSAGEAFHELPDKPMVARTATSTEGASFIVFQVGPMGEPIMVPHSE